MQESFPSEALQRLLDAHTDDTQGLILRLGWRVGLERREMEDLQWIQVSPTHLTVSGRTIPLESNVSCFLTAWRAFCLPLDTPYVVISKHTHARMSGASISQMLRRTLSAAGIEDLTLIDLRRDFVRRQLEDKDWQEALQVTGMSVSSYFRSQELHSLDEYKTCHETYKSASGDLDADTESKLLAVMEQEKTTLAGLAMRLAYDTPLEIHEIVSLSWDQIVGDSIQLPKQTPIPLTPALQDTLRSIRATRTPEDDPHVFLTERTRKPMDESWLLVLIRKPLVRMGIGSVTLRSIHYHVINKQQQSAIMQAVQDRGSLSVVEAASLLQVSQFMARNQLKSLDSAGHLVRIHTRYYLPEQDPTEDQRKKMLTRYMTDNGLSRSAEMAEYLHIGKRLTAKILKEMIDAGTVHLYRSTGEYCLTWQRKFYEFDRYYQDELDLEQFAQA